jgi:hypothetical protein
MTVIIEVEQLDRRTSCSCSSHNAQPCNVPGKVLRPLIAARVEERDDRLCLWIAAFKAIATPFITVATRQRQVVGVIRAARRLGLHVVNGEAHELPAFVGMTILTAALRPLAHDPPRCWGHCHAGLTGGARCGRDD